MGVNRFECRTCPYEWVLDKKWYDRTEVKEKEVEEVFGGKDEWKNADSVASESLRCISGKIKQALRGRISFVQHNALPKAAMVSVHTFTNCRFGVPTSR